MRTLKIALVQMHCEKGAIDRNLDSTRRILEEAAGRGVDIVGFPEMSVTGYADPTRSPLAQIRLDGPEIGRLLELTRGCPCTALAGLIEENPAGKPFITHVAAREGELLGFYRKRTIENEEVEWFSPGDASPIFRHGEISFGIGICADIENESVFADCSRQGAQIVFELAAPGLYGEQATRNWRSGYEWWEGECLKYLSEYARKYTMWIGVATQAGRTVDEDFPGGGFLFSPRGERVYATSDWLPGVVYLEIDLEAGQVVG